MLIVLPTSACHRVKRAPPLGFVIRSHWMPLDAIECHRMTSDAMGGMPSFVIGRQQVAPIFFSLAYPEHGKQCCSHLQSHNQRTSFLQGQHDVRQNMTSVTFPTEHDVRGRGPWPRRKSRPTSRTGRRFQSWRDRLFARKDRLEEQRRQQLEWIRQSIGDIASREADVLTDTCNDSRRDGDSSETDDDGFELENGYCR